MRLSDKDARAIVEIVRSKDTKANVYLYGSRAQDHLKGGDIDLLVESETLRFSDKIDLLITIKEAIGEQKIDLTVQTTAEMNADSFTQKILKTAIRLNRD